MNLKYLSIIAVIILLFSGCTQESQNKISRSFKNWTGTDGILEVYSGGKLIKKFLKIDKLSTAYGTEDNQARAYRYGFGIYDKNFNGKEDNGEKKVYFEISDFSTYIFFEK